MRLSFPWTLCIRQLKHCSLISTHMDCLFLLIEVDFTWCPHQRLEDRLLDPYGSVEGSCSMTSVATTAYQVPSTSQGNMWCVLFSSQDVPHSGLLRLDKMLFNSFIKLQRFDMICDLSTFKVCLIEFMSHIGTSLIKTYNETLWPHFIQWFSIIHAIKSTS